MVDPNLRPTAAEALQHPFLTGMQLYEPYEPPQDVLSVSAVLDPTFFDPAYPAALQTMGVSPDLGRGFEWALDGGVGQFGWGFDQGPYYDPTPGADSVYDWQLGRGASTTAAWPFPIPCADQMAWTQPQGQAPLEMHQLAVPYDFMYEPMASQINYPSLLHLGMGGSESIGQPIPLDQSASAGPLVLDVADLEAYMFSLADATATATPYMPASLEDPHLEVEASEQHQGMAFFTFNAAPPPNPTASAAAEPLSWGARLGSICTITPTAPHPEPPSMSSGSSPMAPTSPPMPDRRRAALRASPVAPGRISASELLDEFRSGLAPASRQGSQAGYVTTGTGRQRAWWPAAPKARDLPRPVVSAALPFALLPEAAPRPPRPWSKSMPPPNISRGRLETMESRCIPGGIYLPQPLPAADAPTANAPAANEPAANEPAADIEPAAGTLPWAGNQETSSRRRNRPREKS